MCPLDPYDRWSRSGARCSPRVGFPPWPEADSEMSVDRRPTLAKVMLRAVPIHHPVVLAHQRARSADLQARLADTITSFAGSMPFVYLHAVGFTVWMLAIESQPWPKLTLVVSLEAIFLSAFVMIGQNRQAAFQQAKADHDFVEQEQELKKNTELTRAIHALTEEIHRTVVPAAPPGHPEDNQLLEEISCR